MKYFPLFLIIFASNFLYAQQTVSELEKYPVFPNCEAINISDLEVCFKNELRRFVYENYKVPQVVFSENYNGMISVLFEINKTGNIEVLYVDAIYPELKEEAKRVFESIPQLQPATFNGNPTFAQFTVPIAIPLVEPGTVPFSEENKLQNIKSEKVITNEYDAIINLPYENEEYNSNINIPLSHEIYTRFDAELNRVGTNTHTSQKPYLYEDVNRYYNFEAENQKLLKNRSSWLGRKLWNEHFITIKGEGYWLTLDPGVDLQLGKDTDADINTFNNTRLVYAQGGLGKDLSFNAVVYESQGRFADYFNRYARSIKPDGGNPGIIPGRGIAKDFKGDAFDYPVATGHVSYSPSRFFNLQLGHGQNFVGDGYRSLFMSDNVSPYPYFKINTTFWKLKYTNTYMSLRDVRPEVTADGSFRTKYMANHYLSLNITKRLNIGFFESVIWENDNDRGFDFNYVNPVIFYRAIEFSTGSRGGNALLGLSGKYKVSDRVNVYGQLIVDEFSSFNIFSGNGSYKNKIGYQLGAKYYDAFGVKDLYLQGEYNRVRPFTYSHNTVTLNYGHNNQSLAHAFGANFYEFVGIARYRRGRIFGDAKLIIAKRGLELEPETLTPFYGGDIYGTEDNRIMDEGNNITQGNTTDFFHAELEGGYLINPATNLKVYASLIYRDFKPTVATSQAFENSTTWVNFGIRTDLFNWYYDF